METHILRNIVECVCTPTQEEMGEGAEEMGEGVVHTSSATYTQIQRAGVGNTLSACVCACVYV